MICFSTIILMLVFSYFFNEIPIGKIIIINPPNNAKMKTEYFGMKPNHMKLKLIISQAEI